jgi:hypothetical protein
MRQGWHQTSRRIYIFLWKEKSDHDLRTRFFVHKRIISAVMRVEFVSDRMSYIILRGRWCDVIVLKIPAATANKIDDIEGRFCVKL